MSVDIASALSTVPVTRLIHFTPAMNLYGIFKDHQIRPASELTADPARGFTVTDELRLDGHRGHICCTFEYPNVYYLGKAREKAEFVNYPAWVCLVLDRDLVLRDGTQFYPCNAARGRGTWAGEDGEALLRMWADPSQPAGLQRRSTHHPAVPTDLQAEVQIQGPIPLSAVSAIVAPTAPRCRELFGTLYPHGLHPEQVEWRYTPLYFGPPYLLANAIHAGATIAETPWLPGEGDLA